MHYCILFLQLSLCLTFPTSNQRSCGESFSLCPDGTECVNWICMKKSGNRSCGQAFVFCRADETCENNSCVKTSKCNNSNQCEQGHECYQDHCVRRRDCPILDLPILPPRNPPCILTEKINARGCLQPKIDCALPKTEPLLL
uniref:Uncharacterized protein n=1 Tax=Plectus sambesii TaxID=2011161 RepID=A0A914VG21_9BILA